jgi:lipoprotein-anchoring transpeptidase ErfK/SrfK
VKPLTVFFLMIGTLVATQAFAQESSPQPLAQQDCKAAIGWSWNEAANVCEPSSQQAEVTPSAQPLTRHDCTLAGLAWEESANVCVGKPKGSTLAAAETASPASTILIDIDKSTQKMTVFVDGAERYHWPVSTGRSGYSTPSGSYTPTSMNEIWYSKEWDNAPMPHAIFFMKDGHAIHGSYEVKNLGRAVSHGCVRIAPQNATLLYDLVKKTGMQNTQVVLSGETPGGESKVASSGSRPRAAFRQRNEFLADSGPQPPRRGGFFRRLFGRP